MSELYKATWAYALKPVRIIRGELREYEAICAGRDTVPWMTRTLNISSLHGAGPVDKR